MADLSEEQKLEIVTMLACFRPPRSIISHFQSLHGLELDHRQVGRYDPQRSYYAGGNKWRDIFGTRRKAFLEDLSAVPVAHMGYRLDMLQRGVETAEESENWVLLARLLEQAAKEMGGIYTSKRTLQISDTTPKNARNMSAEDRKAALTDIFRRAMEERAAGDHSKPVN